MLKNLIKNLRFKTSDYFMQKYAADKMFFELKKYSKNAESIYIDKSVTLENEIEFFVGMNATLIIKKKTHIRSHAQIHTEGLLEIGENTVVGKFSVLGCITKLIVGNDCLIAEGVSIRDNDHTHSKLHLPFHSQGFTAEPVIIGNNVWIGAKVTILKGVTIGDNVIIGANAVVTNDIQRNTIAVGIPAKVVKVLE